MTTDIQFWPEDTIKHTKATIDRTLKQVEKQLEKEQVGELKGREVNMEAEKGEERMTNNT